MKKIHRTRFGALALATVLTTSTLASVPTLASDQKVVINTEYASVELEEGITLEQYAQMQLLSIMEETLAELSFVTEFTMEKAAELGTLELLECKGFGTFAFAEPAFVPEKGITTCELVFTPEDAESYHYENMIGWDAETKTVHRFVQVYCTGLMTEEEKLAKAAKDAAKEMAEKAEAEKKDAVEEGAVIEDAIIMAPGVTVNPDAVIPEATDSAKDAEDAKENGAAEAGKAEADKTETAVTPEAGKAEATVAPEADKAETAVTPEAGKAETTVTPEADKTAKPEVTVTPEATIVPETSVEGSDGVANRTEAVAEVEKAITVLSDVVSNDAELSALIEVSKAYDALTAEEKKAMDMTCGKKLVDLQAAASVYNHTCKGVAVSGNIPWYVSLKVELDNDTENYVPTGLETIVPYEISLWDNMNNVKYMLAEGETAVLSMKIPENLSLYDGLKVVHYLSETVYELIELKFDGEYMSFETASFSPFNVAGSNVLVGGSDKSPVSSTTTTPTATPTPVATATATPTPTPATSSSSSTTKNSSSSSSSGTTKGSSSSSSSSTTKNSTSSSSTKGGKTTAVKTGDEAQTSRFLMLGMSAMAMLSAAGAVLLRRRRPEND